MIRLAPFSPFCAQEKLEKEAWNSALGRAEGKTEKNDIALLKKTIKRREKQKERSRSTWSAPSVFVACASSLT